LDEDDVNREPVVGDEVLLLDNAVTEGYPETEAELASLVQGAKYKVHAIRGGKIELDKGLLISPARLAVIAQPKGIQNGDLVVMKQAYGPLKVGDYLSVMNGMLLDKAGAAFAVPAEAYNPATGDKLVEHLLQKMKLTLPFEATVIESHPAFGNQRVTITTCWPLNNQELAFWTEDTPTKDSWFERSELQITTITPESNIRFIRGASPEDSKVIIGTEEVSLSALEAALAI
jgi:hypothetical protein